MDANEALIETGLHLSKSHLFGRVRPTGGSRTETGVAICSLEVGPREGRLAGREGDLLVGDGGGELAYVDGLEREGKVGGFGGAFLVGMCGRGVGVGGEGCGGSGEQGSGRLLEAAVEEFAPLHSQTGQTALLLEGELVRPASGRQGCFPSPPHHHFNPRLQPRVDLMADLLLPRSGTPPQQYTFPWRPFHLFKQSTVTDYLPPF